MTSGDVIKVTSACHTYQPNDYLGQNHVLAAYWSTVPMIMEIWNARRGRCLILMWLLIGATQLFAQTRPLISPPNTATAADSVVTFNEVMYHPLEDDPRLEWIELYNQMSVNIDLSNWRVEGAIDFRFPTNTTLNANSYLVISADPATLKAATGATNVVGPFGNRLSNSGETLRLRNNSNRLMDEMSYTDSEEWPVAADGSGASLAKRGRFDASSIPANWQASSQIGGTPGQANFSINPSSPPTTDALISAVSASRLLVPLDDRLGSDWLAPGFDDLNWISGKAALGYDTTPPDPTQVSNVALGKSVIDGSGAYNNNPFDRPDAAGNFVAQNVLDGSTADVFGANYWLGRQGKVNEYFTIDLGASLRVQEIRLRNTHNTQFNDRGTATFQIFASEEVDLNKQLVRPVLILSGTLAPYRAYDPIPSDNFTASNGLIVTNLRYLKFVALTANNIGNNVGLNELEAYAVAGTQHFRPFIATDIESSMYQKNNTVYVRLPFELPKGVQYDVLTLRMRYADGFVAYLNGTEVLHRNAPERTAWNSGASLKRSVQDSVREESFDLSRFLGQLSPGRNLLAIQGLASFDDNSSFLLNAQLFGRPADSVPYQGVHFNEAAAANSPRFFVELFNSGKELAILTDWQIVSEAGARYRFGQTALAGGEYLTVGTNDLGFAVGSGEKLFLIGPGQSVIDGVRLQNRLIGKVSSQHNSAWLSPAAPTPGAPNQFLVHSEVVINEIMYHHSPIYGVDNEPRSKVDEEWVELYNRSNLTIDISHWRLEGDIRFTFPSPTVLAPGAYLVIAKNAALLRAKYPGIATVGDFNGKLPANGGQIRLKDEEDNPADEVTYYDDHPWPANADGGGSTLELRDPRSDNSAPESWAASLESGKAAWKHYTYRANALTPVYTPAIFSFHEFRLGLLTDGEALIDNITVKELSDSGSRQLLQNVDFTAGTSHWRLLGNHSHSFVEPDPENSSNPVLHLVARGPTSYMDNHLETTLKVGAALVPVVTGREYQIDFDAKWVAGSPQVHTELYYNKVVKTTILSMPDRLGTPGRQNSTYSTNIGPTYWGLRHAPVLPSPSEDIEVAIHADDPDTVSGMKLFYVVKGVSQYVDMSRSASDHTLYFGTIPRQIAGAVIQIYVQGTDARNTSSTYPRGGPESCALIKVDAAKLVAAKQTVRTIMIPKDAALLHTNTNLMSDDLLGCTVVHNEAEVFYDAKIRLHGSMYSRTDPSTTGMTIKFPADHLFRGSRPSIIARRRGLVETFLKHILTSAGDLPANYDDLIHFVSHRTDNTGTARLILANYDDTYVDSQFENDNDGTVFKLEGIREFQATSDGTPEGYKLPMPAGFVVGYDIDNLGEDPEQYRWSIGIQSARSRDDYSSIIRMGKAFSQSGESLRQSAGAAIDVDEWARLFALQLLLGISDVYTVDNPHNLCFYARPSDGRVVALQNDWEFAFYSSSVTSIYGNKNLFKVLQLPGYRRLYQGHLLDLINTTCTRDYLTLWGRHYGTVAGEAYAGYGGYVQSRGTAVKAKLLAQIPFEITSNAGVDYAVNTPTVTLQGRGWINVRQLRRTGDPQPLELNWLDDERWETVIPLRVGTNPIELTAYGFRGESLGSDSINITTTVSDSSQRDYIRVSELMYHPADPGPGERAAGFTNADDFEFVELQNTGPVNVALTGIKFTAGIAFDCTGASVPVLGKGQRVLIVKSKAAFELRYGTQLPVVGVYSGSLNNAGETLRLEDAQGTLIQEITYSDTGNWPAAADGAGSSLEVIDLKGDYSDPTHWQASAPIGGTPGFGILVRPMILPLEYTPAQVVLRFNAVAGQSYTIYRRVDLASGDWEKIGVIPPQFTDRVEQVVDTRNGSRVFYQISTP